jgi:hypothetical protein
MNRVAFWVAQTTVGATVPTALAQATASPLPEIEAGARLDPDIAAQPLVAMNAIFGREGMARGASIQRAKILCAKIQCAKVQCAKIQCAKVRFSIRCARRASVTAAKDSRICDKNGSVPMPTRACIDKSSWAPAAGPSRAAEGGSRG